MPEITTDINWNAAIVSAVLAFYIKLNVACD